MEIAVTFETNSGHRESTRPRNTKHAKINWKNYLKRYDIMKIVENGSTFFEHKIIYDIPNNVDISYNKNKSGIPKTYNNAINKILLRTWTLKSRSPRNRYKIRNVEVMNEDYLEKINQIPRVA